MILFLILGVALLGAAVASLMRALTANRLKTTTRLAEIDEYGFSAESTAPEELLAPKRKSSTGEFVSAVGAAFAQRFGTVSEENLRAELMSAGIYGMSPRTLLGYRVIAAVLVPTFI